MNSSMKWTLVTASILTAVSVVSTAPVLASDVSDTVRARGNARAGGPTNGHDAWILDRYGALSGTYTSDYSGLTTPKSKRLSAKALRKLRKGY